MIEDIGKMSLLYDFYGILLTERQNQFMQRYYGENLSLSEIADEFKISRQSVHDTLKKAEKTITEYENKLELVEKFQKRKKAVSEIVKKLENLYENNLSEKIEIIDYINKINDIE